MKINLPKIKKSFIFLFFYCFIVILLPSSVLADCDLFDCIPDRGTCSEGAVQSCGGEGRDQGIKKCQGGSWIDTEEPTNDLCTYDPQDIDLSGIGIGPQIEEAINSSTLNHSKWTDQMFKNMTYIMRRGIIPPTYVSRTNSSDSALGVTVNLVGAMYSRPAASTGEYLAYLKSNLGIAQPAYAQQGIGWQALSPVLKVWKAFRNAAYLGFVIIFIVIGFMIMFRAKIDPQTVISIQTALPKIIITLLIITFSYALAGLMIDLIYIVIYLVLGIFSLSGLVTDTGVVIDKLLGENLFQIVFGRIFLTVPGEAVDEIIRSVFSQGVLAEIFGFIGGNILFELILAITLLFAVFKLFLSLVTCYVTLIFQIVLAPITLLFNALPGSKSLGNWLKGMLSNIAPFPVVALMFLMAGIFMGGSGACNSPTNPWCVNPDVGYTAQVETGVWAPPFLSLSSDSAGGGTHPLIALIGLGMILATPKAASLVKKMFQVEPSGIGGAVLAPFTSGLGVAAGAIQQYRGYRKEAEQKAAAETRHTQLLGALGARPPGS